MVKPLNNPTTFASRKYINVENIAMNSNKRKLLKKIATGLASKSFVIPYDKRMKLIKVTELPINTLKAVSLNPIMYRTVHITMDKTMVQSVTVLIIFFYRFLNKAKRFKKAGNDTKNQKNNS